MGDRPKVSPGSSPSRHGSGTGTKTQDSQPHSKRVQFGRESRPSFTRQDFDRDSFKANGPPRSKSIDKIKREAGVWNEQSPLLGPRGSEEVERLSPLDNVLSPASDESWDGDGDGDESQETKSSWYLLLLTMAIGGLQIAWSVELSNGSPYLLGLGISKSLLAFVWIAGPLSGTLVQPYVGIKSDRCRSRFGKRRPFMLGGAAATIVSLMLLAWTREIIGGIGWGVFRAGPDSQGVVTASIVFAVLMIYVLDFSINVIQAAIRAFIVDNAPTHQQDSANAWASRISGVGNIVGYLFGYVDLPKYFWFFGDTQFKVLCVVASLAMAGTLAISCSTISERDPRLDGAPEEGESGVLGFFKGLYHSMRKLPTQITRVCQVQFFAWIGWFPFLFYITTYIGEMYVEDTLRENPNMTPAEVDEEWEKATRIGTRALLIFALTTFTASVILPFIVARSFEAPHHDPVTPLTPGTRTPGAKTPGTKTPGTPGASRMDGYFSYNPIQTPRAARTPLTPGASRSEGYFGQVYQPARAPHTPLTPGASRSEGYFGYRPKRAVDRDLKQGHQKRSFIKRFMRRFSNFPEIRWLTLRRAWMLSHVLFALLTWLTFAAKTTWAATVLVALIGIPWAVTNWAPYALIAAEISKRDQIRRGQISPPQTRDGQLLAEGEDPSEGADQAGIVLGIHNVAIAAPQVIATLVSSVIFKALQKPRGSVGDDSVAWVLRFGGCAALVAAYLTRRVGEEEDSEK